MKKSNSNWKEFEKELNITNEGEAEIRLEMDLIKAVVEARKNNKLSQRDLSSRTKLKQPAIARLESGKRSPQLSTVIKALYPLGYTLKVVELEEPSGEYNIKPKESD